MDRSDDFADYRLEIASTLLKNGATFSILNMVRGTDVVITPRQQDWNTAQDLE
jgi:predicted GTPase